MVIAVAANDDLPELIWLDRHRFHGVVQQVQDHLLQLDAIPGGKYRVIVEVEGHHDVAAYGVCPDQVHHLADRGGEIDRGHLHLAFAHHLLETLDHIAGTTIVADDVLQDGAELLDVRCGPVEHASGGLRVGHDGGERLIQLVSQRGGHLADRRHAGHVRQFLPAALRFHLGPAEFGNIRADDHRASLRSIQRHGRVRPPRRFRTAVNHPLEGKAVA